MTALLERSGMVPAKYELVKRTAKGAEFARAVRSGLYSYLAMGGAVGGVKSFTTISTLIALLRIYPGARAAIVRKDLPTFRRNTIPTIEKMRPTNFMADLNRSEWSYKCKNGSELLLFSEQFDTDPDHNRWKGLEVNFFLLEEANELQESSHFKAIERCGRWVIPSTPANPTPRQPAPLILYSFNPCDNWPKHTFYQPHADGTLAPPWFFLPTAITDNPFLPDAYLESIKNLPDREYRRFVLCDWNTTTDPRQLIHTDWLKQAANVDPKPGKARAGVDGARYGDDLSVAFRWEGNQLILPELARYHGVDPVEFGDLLHPIFLGIEGTTGAGKPIDACEVRIDTVGVGGGTFDYLKKKHFHCRSIVAGGTPLVRPLGDPNYTIYRYKNIRSQMWWEFREKVRSGRAALPWPLPKRLFEDLTAPRYEIIDKVIEVEKKDDIKLRIGRSTDDGDAVVMAAFDLPRFVRTTTAGASRSYSTV